MNEIPLHIYNSISDFHSRLNLPKPINPLVSVVKLDDISVEQGKGAETIVYNFYAVFLKKNYEGKIKYGHQYYDFDNGTMTFYSPGQRITVEENTPTKIEGWMLIIHPDFLQTFGIAQKIRDYGFFSYAANEALHLSEKEESTISGILQNLKEEIEAAIDGYTQEVLISHIDLLLNYCNRFYNRQFITRKPSSSDLLIKFENLLIDYFSEKNSENIGLPTVHYFAERVFLSPNYLSDMLKSVTGQTTQQHIHNHLIDKTKVLLTTTNLSVSEIAYQLGFEYPQSLNKLFKNKTSQTPLEYKASFS